MTSLQYLPPDEVARLTRSEREARVTELIRQSRNILSTSKSQHILADGRTVAATVLLFSGGNDSTVLSHLFRSSASHAAHINTTIGIETTREFVRSVCQEWQLPLLERSAPREVDHYRALVLDQGFPGPGHHFKMYQRLKERALEQIRRELVINPREQRVLFLAGRRRTESARRRRIPASERKGSTVWVSPLVNWTALDMNTYRLMQGDVPVNEVSELIHMSGECCCGAFARPGERDELKFWFPQLVDEIEELETAIADREDIPLHRRTWGWGASVREPDSRQTKVGALCGSCEAPARVDD